MSPSKDPAPLNSSTETFLKETSVTPPKPGLALVVEEPRFGICRLPPKARIPRWVHRSSFFTISRSRDELSIVCEQHLMPEGEVPDDVKVERGWRAIRVLEPLDFSLVGVLESLARPLTEARVSIFCISTYDTDYLLVRHSNLERAIVALEESGHRFQENPANSTAGKAAAENGDQHKAPLPAAAEAPEQSIRPKLRERKAASDQSTAPSQGNGGPHATTSPGLSAPFKGTPETSNIPFSEPNLPASQAQAVEPIEHEEPETEQQEPETPSSPTAATAGPVAGAKDRVARALADLSTALKAPWRARADETPVKAMKAQPAEPASRESEVNEVNTAQAEDEFTIELDVAAPTQGKTSLDSKVRPQTAPRKRRTVARTAPPPAKESRTTKSAVVNRDLSTKKDLPAKKDVLAKKESSADHRADTSEVEVTLDWDAEEDRGEVQSQGLFTGAIPQGDVEVTDQSFGHLGLSNPILETIHKIGFEHPTPIQAQVIPHALKGLDIIGLAETGSGKTAAFCLPMAERLIKGQGLRGLILCPTREIALQTKAFLEVFRHDHNLRSVEVIGGVRMGPQIDGFRNDPDILVATPGRLADHLRRRNVNLDKLEELVLDEADHMLDLGFLPQIKEILEQAPKKRRTMMFSATMPPPIERLAQLFMQNPVQVDIRPAGQVAEGIAHRLYLVRDEDMKTCLLRLLEEVSGSTLVFSRRKLYTEWLARQMEQAGLKVARIHSDRSQSQRVQALRGFREGKYRILVATDVAARGLDVPRIEHVINYGLPETTEDYVHRAGRTARGNAVGTVSSIGTWQDKVMVRQLEHALEIKIPRCELDGVEPYKELPKRKGFRRRRLL